MHAGRIEKGAHRTKTSDQPSDAEPEEETAEDGRVHIVSSCVSSRTGSGGFAIRTISHRPAV